ncbi:MAG: twin-arginine translocase TatA/TatE family subunit, partial [Nitrospinae bacterium]|nr:twin-arginine translocase TatA/TatE family subunit [Nitrospinota bacterium]
EAQEEEEGAQVEEGQQAAIEEGKEGESEENLTDEEKEALARKKAQEEGDAKDLAMKEKADSFTASLPRKGSYDFSADQEKS